MIILFIFLHKLRSLVSCLLKAWGWEFKHQSANGRPPGSQTKIIFFLANWVKYTLYEQKYFFVIWLMGKSDDRLFQMWEQFDEVSPFICLISGIIKVTKYFT